MRNEEQFGVAYASAVWMANFHNKPFYVVPTDIGYAVSAFDVNESKLPDGTKTLKIEPYATKSEL